MNTLPPVSTYSFLHPDQGFTWKSPSQRHPPWSPYLKSQPATPSSTHTPPVFPDSLAWIFFFQIAIIIYSTIIYTIHLFSLSFVSLHWNSREAHCFVLFFYACNPKHQKECLAPSRHSTHLRILKYTITLTAVLRIDYRKLRAEAERPTKKPLQFSTRSRRCHFQRDQ